MKPFYTKANSELNISVTSRYDELNTFYPDWHYHDEYELVYIHKGCGIRYVGDSISPFQSGDLVLLGSRLPHIWQSDSQTSSIEKSSVSSVIYMKPEFILNDFFRLPMMVDIQRLFQLSNQGISFINFKGAEKDLSAIHNSKSTEKIIRLLDFLFSLSKHHKIHLLSSTEFNLQLYSQNSDRLTNVFNYIINNYRSKISLVSIAQIANMTSEAFCTYFKKRTRNTVFSYINNLRIGYGCQLLINSNMNIELVGQESGFYSTTLFNRKFKEKMNLTPNEYRMLHRF